MLNLLKIGDRAIVTEDIPRIDGRIVLKAGTEVEVVLRDQKLLSADVNVSKVGSIRVFSLRPQQLQKIVTHG